MWICICIPSILQSYLSTIIACCPFRKDDSQSDTSSSVSQTSYDPSKPHFRGMESEIPETASQEDEGGVSLVSAKSSSKGMLLCTLWLCFHTSCRMSELNTLCPFISHLAGWHRINYIHFVLSLFKVFSSGLIYMYRVYCTNTGKLRRCKDIVPSMLKKWCKQLAQKWKYFLLFTVHDGIMHDACLSEWLRASW